ncbi:MAG: DUF1405 domain-containing protein, partial [Candidatus Bilamarchaeaceae archaeon]
SLMVLAVFFGVKNSEFRLLVGVGMVKYGIWTLMIFILYSSYYWEPSLLWQTEVLFLGHILMVWGGLIMLPERPTRIGLVIAAGWFLLNDVMDYGFGLRPAFPEDFLWFVERFSFASTIIFSFALYYWCGAIRRMRIVAWGRKSLGVS